MARWTFSDPQERFAAKYVIDPETGCWVWTASLRHGYGQFYDGTTVRNAHAVAYRWWGADPYDETLVRDHLCRNKACVNPEHLQQVTSPDNVRLHFALQTTCKEGHPLDGRFPGNGRRYCKTCDHNRAVARYAKKVA